MGQDSSSVAAIKKNPVKPTKKKADADKSIASHTNTEDAYYRLQRIIDCIEVSQGKTKLEMFVDFLNDETGRDGWDSEWNGTLDELYKQNVNMSSKDFVSAITERSVAEAWV